MNPPAAGTPPNDLVIAAKKAGIVSLLGTRETEGEGFQQWVTWFEESQRQGREDESRELLAFFVDRCLTSVSDVCKARYQLVLGQFLLRQGDPDSLEEAERRYLG